MEMPADGHAAFRGHSFFVPIMLSPRTFSVTAWHEQFIHRHFQYPAEHIKVVDGGQGAPPDPPVYGLRAGQAEHFLQFPYAVAALLYCIVNFPACQDSIQRCKYVSFCHTVLLSVVMHINSEPHGYQLENGNQGEKTETGKTSCYMGKHMLIYETPRAGKEVEENAGNIYFR